MSPRENMQTETLWRQIQGICSKWAVTYFHTETLRRLGGHIYK